MSLKELQLWKDSRPWTSNDEHQSGRNPCGYCVDLYGLVLSLLSKLCYRRSSWSILWSGTSHANNSVQSTIIFNRFAATTWELWDHSSNSWITDNSHHSKTFKDQWHQTCQTEPTVCSLKRKRFYQPKSSLLNASQCYSRSFVDRFPSFSIISRISNLIHPPDAYPRIGAPWGPSSGVKIPMTSCHWKAGGSWSVQEVIFRTPEGSKFSKSIIVDYNMSSNVFECLRISIFLDPPSLSSFYLPFASITKNNIKLHWWNYRLKNSCQLRQWLFTNFWALLCRSVQYVSRPSRLRTSAGANFM